MSQSRLLLGLPAPAKVNLFLHVVGRRRDGFHELQTVFAPIDLADTLDFERLDDGRIERSGDLLGAVDDDLCVRAARALCSAAARPGGAAIHVVKRIPAGSGLGGGSSDAATTLLGLNRLWDLNWSRERLAQVALTLGADVPFFLQAGAAFGAGIGEQLTPIELPPLWLALVDPKVHVATAEIYAAAELTRNTKLTTISAFSAHAPDLARAPHGTPFGTNDLEPVVRRRVPAIDAALRLVQQAIVGSVPAAMDPAQMGPARMTGSGGALFAAFGSEAEAGAAALRIGAAAPPHWTVRVCGVLREHPLAAW